MRCFSWEEPSVLSVAPATASEGRYSRQSKCPRLSLFPWDQCPAENDEGIVGSIQGPARLSSASCGTLLRSLTSVSRSSPGIFLAS